jgi:hypothetical protein
MRRWQAWLGLFLVIPLAAMSGAVAFLVYRQAVTGQLSTVVKGYGYTSRTIVFADRPASFLLMLAMHAAFAAMLVAVTVIVARLSIRRLRARS